MNELTIAQAAYLAGVIDSDGCITCVTRAPNPKRRELHPQIALSIRVQVTNKDLVDWIYSVTGIGRVVPVKAANARSRATWLWSCSTVDGSDFIRAIYPYMIVKKEQAYLFVEMRTIRLNGGPTRLNPERQQEICDRFRVLNKRGV